MTRRHVAAGSAARTSGRAKVAVAAGTAALVCAALAFPLPAWAHGLVGRQDLPIPRWLFGWAAAVVLIVSFVALAVLWPKPRLEQAAWRPLRGRAANALVSPPAEAVAGAIGALLLVAVVWSGLAGVQSPAENLAPTLVYIVFWLGFVPASVLFGDVFRAFNPWRAIGRACAGLLRRFAGELPAPLPYPERLGRWPAVAGLFLFGWMELIAQNGDQPRSLAIATLVYSAMTFIGMALYGVERWIERGEAFSVYFNLFSRLSVFERRGETLGLRPLLSGLTTLAPLPGTVAFLAMVIGTTSFDGGSEGPFYQSLVPDLLDFWLSLGLSRPRAGELAFGVGYVATVVFVYLVYRLAVLGARSVGGGHSVRGLARAFVHSLVPIGVAYVAAHYVSLLVFQGQAVAYLASDPLGDGWDLFGTATATIDFSIVGATTFWYLQVGFVVAGHVAALVVAHDRALVLYDEPRRAARSQYWLLAAMVGFTTLALWLLSQFAES